MSLIPHHEDDTTRRANWERRYVRFKLPCFLCSSYRAGMFDGLPVPVCWECHEDCR